MIFGRSEASCCLMMYLFLQVTYSATHQPTDPDLKLEVIPLAAKPVVHTLVGGFRGLRALDGNYSMFMGIPYARVDPDNVFGPSIPHVFHGIFDAFDDSAVCPQADEVTNSIIGSLDCLRLNIYVPNSANIESSLPVMVYIYGGQFAYGFASRYLYGPRFLVRHDVVLVTLNYRVGPYGFMCLDIPEAPGNTGLRDQVEALRWIKRNIRPFGGDDSKITIFGNSAGAISVDLHQYYLRERLYHRVIIQSGVALRSRAVRNSDPEYALKLAKKFNHTKNNILEAVSFLSKQDPHKLIAAYNDSGFVVGPCVEKYYIPKYPMNMNSVKDVDVLIGFNNDESYVECTKFEQHCSVPDVLNSTFNFRGKENLFDRIKNVTTHFYCGDDAQCAGNKRPTIDVHGDFNCYHPTLRTIRKYLDSGVKNMYLYLFSYTGKRSFYKNKKNVPYTEGGANHADEIGYLFDISYMKTWLPADDMVTVDRITELWTNFAKCGNPTPRPTQLIPIKWPRVTQDKLPYLEIDTEVRLGSRPMHKRMSFLDLLYETIGHYQLGMDNEN